MVRQYGSVDTALENLFRASGVVGCDSDPSLLHGRAQDFSRSSRHDADLGGDLTDPTSTTLSRWSGISVVIRSKKRSRPWTRRRSFPGKDPGSRKRSAQSRDQRLFPNAAGLRGGCFGTGSWDDCSDNKFGHSRRRGHAGRIA